MKNLGSNQSNQRSGALRLCITVGLAALFLAFLLCGLGNVSPTYADPGVLYVDAATGQDSPTCGTTDSPCKTISYTLNSRANSSNTIHVAQWVYTENITVNKQVTLEGGCVPSGTLWLTRTGETIIDGSNSRTVWGDWDGSGIHMSIVITDAGYYKMWYGGWGLMSQGLGLATLPDGITRTKYAGNPIFTVTVNWEEGSIGHPHVIKDSTTYKMWYGPNDDKIGYARSSDGVNWTVTSSILAPHNQVTTTTLTIVSTHRYESPLEHHISQYEITHPNVKIDAVYIDDYDDMYSLLASPPSNIDIFEIDVTMSGTGLANRSLIPLNSYIQNSQSITLSDFITGAVDAMTILDHIVGIPWYTDAGLLFYRTDLLQTYGYTYPQTFAELKTQALTIKSGQGLDNGFIWQGGELEDLTTNFLEHLWGSGGDIYHPPCTVVLSSTQAISALNTMIDYISSGTSPISVTTHGSWESIELFLKGDTVFMRNWPYAWSHLQDDSSLVKGKVGTAPVPHLSAQTSVATLGGWNLSISAKSKNPAAAFEFIEYLTAVEQQKYNALNKSYMPTRLSLYQDSDVCSTSPFMCDLYEVFAKARPRPAVARYEEFTIALREEVHSALTDNKSSTAAIADAQTRLQDLVACQANETRVISSTTGGSLSTPDNSFTVEFPAETLTETVVVTYFTTVYVPPTPLTDTLSFVEGSSFVLAVAAQDSGQPVTTFNPPITLTLAYNGGLEDVELRYWDGSTWSTDGITIVERDLVNHQLIATVSHLSQFALFGPYEVYLPVILKN